jgi:hypothetical protein
MSFLGQHLFSLFSNLKIEQKKNLQISKPYASASLWFGKIRSSCPLIN